MFIKDLYEIINIFSGESNITQITQTSEAKVLGIGRLFLLFICFILGKVI